MNKQWHDALRISYASGFPFYDRDNILRNEGIKPTMIDEIIDLYFRV